jgi:hypothetical protein
MMRLFVFLLIVLPVFHSHAQQNPEVALATVKTYVFELNRAITKVEYYLSEDEDGTIQASVDATSWETLDSLMQLAPQYKETLTLNWEKLKSNDEVTLKALLANKNKAELQYSLMDWKYRQQDVSLENILQVFNIVEQNGEVLQTNPYWEGLFDTPDIYQDNKYNASENAAALTRLIDSALALHKSRTK